MWTCEKCGRSFKNIEQDHYCGEAPKTIDEYIDLQRTEVQPYLCQVRNTLRESLPKAQEKISWSMPTYWKGCNIIHFAAFKKHLGIYPGEEAVVHFANKLKHLKTSKGAIQFPYNEPLPLDLIRDIATWCYESVSKR